MNNPLVSVIVPTKNSEKFLEKCLGSIKNQTYKNFEIIVVDNNSTDKTKEIARKYTDKVLNFGPERSAQRNFGVNQSNGEYVVIIDSDMELSEKVVEACTEKINSDKKIKGVVIPEESFGIGFWAQCKKLEKSFYVGVDYIEAARFFEKNAFLKADGFDEGMISGEDWDLSQRIEKEGRIDRINYFIYHNEGKINLFKTIKKKSFYAGNFTNYANKNKNNKKFGRQTRIFSRYKLFLSQPNKLFKNPVIGFGMLFMKTCEFAFGGAGYFVEKIKKYEKSVS
jgi:glycosyltransferase involved in cell wall biosynthesis